MSGLYSEHQKLKSGSPVFLAGAAATTRLYPAGGANFTSNGPGEIVLNLPTGESHLGSLRSSMSRFLDHSLQ